MRCQIVIISVVLILSFAWLLIEINSTPLKRLLHADSHLPIYPPEDLHKNFSTFTRYFSLGLKILHMFVLKLIIPQFTLGHSVDLHWKLSEATYLRMLADNKLPHPQYLLGHIIQHSYFGFIEKNVFTETPEQTKACRANQSGIVDSWYHCTILENFGVNLLILCVILGVSALLSLSILINQRSKGRLVGLNLRNASSRPAQVIIRAQQFFGMSFFFTMMDGACVELLIFAFINMKYYYLNSIIMGASIVMSVGVIIYYALELVYLILGIGYFCKMKFQLKRLWDTLKPGVVMFAPLNNLYVEVDLTRSSAVLMPLLRMIRGIAIAIVVVASEKSPLVQLTVCFTIEVSYFMYLLVCKPHKTTLSDHHSVLSQVLLILIIFIKGLSQLPALQADMGTKVISLIVFSLILAIYLLSSFHALFLCTVEVMGWNDILRRPPEKPMAQKSGSELGGSKFMKAIDSLFAHFKRKTKRKPKPFKNEEQNIAGVNRAENETGQEIFEPMHLAPIKSNKDDNRDIDERDFQKISESKNFKIQNSVTKLASPGKKESKQLYHNTHKPIVINEASHHIFDHYLKPNTVIISAIQEEIPSEHLPSRVKKPLLFPSIIPNIHAYPSPAPSDPSFQDPEITFGVDKNNLNNRSKLNLKSLK
jgi:hypothetical protein